MNLRRKNAVTLQVLKDNKRVLNWYVLSTSMYLFKHDTMVVSLPRVRVIPRIPLHPVYF